MDRQELIDYLVDEGAITDHQAHEMDSYSLFVSALEWNGIINFDVDIKGWIEPYYQEHFSENPEELNLNVNWIKKKYHELVNKGVITENESEPKPNYPNEIFLP